MGMLEITNTQRQPTRPSTTPPTITASVYVDLLRRLERFYDQPLPYVAGVYQGPVREDRDLAYLQLRVHSVMRSPGKLKYLAGSESGMGAFVSDVRPEDVAARLRELT